MPILRATALAAAIFLTYCLSWLLGFDVEEIAWAFWMPNAVILIALLTQRLREWPLYLIAVLAGK
jgi:hypothetical protein